MSLPRAHLNPGVRWQRLRFVAITARNLDEFFCKRVGALKRQQAAGEENLIRERSMEWSPTKQLKMVAKYGYPGGRGGGGTESEEVENVMYSQSYNQKKLSSAMLPSGDTRVL